MKENEQLRADIRAQQTMQGRLLVKSFRVVDLNGDQDGYPDTNETVELSITVHNPALSQDLTNVVIRISTTDPRIDCIPTSVGTIASLPAGADAETSTPFRLHVHPDADRAGLAVKCNDTGSGGACSNFVDVEEGCLSDSDCYRTALQDYSAILNVDEHSDQSPTPDRLQISLDLDLNSNNPPAPTTTFTEDFEFGFGKFQFLNIDDNKANNTLSDGYRCQYNDPDFINSNSYGETQCYLGFASGQSPINDWHVHRTTAPDGGRAFMGSQSLHYGKHPPDNPDFDTYGLSQMDAVRTKSNVNLAARVCRDDPATGKQSCDSAADCLSVGGGPCVSASPELSFKHQIETQGIYIGEAIDRAVVHVQLAGSTVWQKVHPFQNVYDATASTVFRNCRFDPIDDGNDEDSYFDPADPNRQIGPSSTCYPELVFFYAGDTEEPFDPARIGGANDGPGLQGSMGIGTWVESKFDLSRFRGRTVKIRFLFTTMKVSDIATPQEFFTFPFPWDAGWYVDDVRVTQTLGAASPTMGLDEADNGALPGNMDGDARGDDCDCAPADPGAFAIPEEVNYLAFAADKATLAWPSAAPASGNDTVHDVLRGVLAELPVGAGASEVCLAQEIQGATVVDPVHPAEGSGFWYLVRANNACGVGTYGFRSDGLERTSTACP